MNIPLDEVIFFDCITTHPSTGAATDADSTPTFAVYEESTDTDIGIGGNLTKRTSLTGNYRGTFTLSAANGFEAGKWYSIIVSATVNAIAGKAVAKNFRVVIAEGTAGTPVVDVGRISNDATAADNAEAFFDGTGYAGTNNVIPLVTLTSTLTTYTGNTVQTGDSFAYLGTNMGLLGVNLTAADDAVMARLGAPAGASVSADVAAVKTDQTTILARLGAWTGSGLNTILGALRAMAGKAAALTPTDISTGTTFNNVTDSLEALADAGVGGDATLANQTTIINLLSGSIVSRNPVSFKNGKWRIDVVRGDTYNGSTGWPKFGWDVEKDYTGYAMTLTIRHATSDIVLAEFESTVADADRIEVDATPTETALTLMEDIDWTIPHVFDVELRQSATVVETPIIGIAWLWKDHSR